MSDLEKGRAQRDAQRATAHRPSGSTAPEQAILRHLGIALYTERRRAESAEESAKEPAAKEPVDIDSTNRSAAR